MHRRLTLIWLMGASVALSFTGALGAGVVGYWRFEGATSAPSFLADSGPNGLDLSKDGDPVSYTLPTTGRGARFNDPMPGTGYPNQYGAQLSHTAGTGYGNFYVADTGDRFTPQPFTAELYFNRSDASADNECLVSQWGVIGDQRSWNLSVCRPSGTTLGAGTATEDELFLVLSADGTAASQELVPSGWFFPEETSSPGTDWFVAVSVDPSNIGSDAIVFSRKNLTTGSPLETTTQPYPTALNNTLHNSSFQFEIGTLADSDYRRPTGVIDEIRLSQGVLGREEMLPLALPFLDPFTQPDGDYFPDGVTPPDVPNEDETVDWKRVQTAPTTAPGDEEIVSNALKLTPPDADHQISGIVLKEPYSFDTAGGLVYEVDLTDVDISQYDDNGGDLRIKMMVSEEDYPYSYTEQSTSRIQALWKLYVNESDGSIEAADLSAYMRDDGETGSTQLGPTVSVSDPFGPVHLTMSLNESNIWAKWNDELLLDVPHLLDLDGTDSGNDGPDFAGGGYWFLVVQNDPDARGSATLDNARITRIPEPSSLVLLLLALAAAGCCQRRG